MSISPHRFTNYDSFADAVAHDAIKALPRVTNYDDYDARRAKRDAIRAALDVAEDVARDKWEAYVEHMEDLYERGVGPGWD